MVAEIVALDPKSASYVSPYYVSVLIDNKIERLNTVNGRYGVGYVRVSTVNQADDGWSIPDQARRVVSYYVGRREAFRVFSDASLSGKLPNNDPGLIDKMLRASAQRYESAYRAVFRESDYPNDWPEMETHIQRVVAGIKTGLSAEVATSDLEPIPVGGKRRALFRPALTKLMEAVSNNLTHTLTITDMTRLSRSQSLSASLTDELTEHKVKIVGLVESLDWMKDELGGALTAAILSVIAEYKLREVCLGSMRGLATMLDQKKPHGTLPYYLRRDENGNAVKIMEYIETVKKIIDFWIGNPQLKVDAICHYLNEHLDEYPAPVLEGEKRSRRAKGKWHRDTLRPMLQNEMLLGHQKFFGRQWETVPRIIDDKTFEKLQIVLAPQNMNSAAHLAQGGRRHTDPNHLLTGVLECQCGHAMTFYPMSKEFSYYRCTEMRHSGKTDEHCVIQAKSAEDFFDQLVLIYGDGIISELSDNEDTRLLRDQIANLQDQRKELNSSLLEAKVAARKKAEDILRASDSKVTPEGIDAVARTNHTVLSVQGEIDNIEEQIKQREIVLSQIVPEGQVATVKDNIAKWDTLSVPQRNTTLRSVIKKVKFRLTEGGGMTVEIVPIGLKPAPMPIVVLNTKIYNSSKHVRRFPSIGDWATTW
ncbi:MAG: recombinase family protein [Armatimonas sp.]